MSALDVLCPICLSSPGDPCRSVMKDQWGGTVPNPCEFHPSRVQRARRDGFRLVDPVEAEMNIEESDKQEITPADVDSAEGILGTDADDAGHPHDAECANGTRPCGETHLLDEATPDAPKPLAFDAGQLMQQMQDVYSKCGPTDLLFALRCPCGQLMALGIPRDYYAKTTFKRLMVQMLQNFVPVLGEHLELLSEKIESAESVPLKNRRQDHPTKEQIIAEYHNHPCPLRTPVAEADVASELGLKEETTTVQNEP